MSRNYISDSSSIFSMTAGVNLVFTYAAGESASRFLLGLRDEQKIYGTRCPVCQRVLVPARSFCPRCLVDMDEWVEVGPQGTLVAFAAGSSATGKGEKKMKRIALIRLDGADTAFVHFIGEANFDRLRIGGRVTAVFAGSRNGTILDIAYFKPA